MKLPSLFRGVLHPFVAISLCLLAGLLSANSIHAEEITLFYWGDRYSQDNPTVTVENGTSRQVGGVAVLGGMLKVLRQKYPNSMTICTGNDFSGSPASVRSKGKSNIETLNRLGVDIMGVGIGELNYGWQNLLDRKSSAKFDLMSANLMLEKKKDNLVTPFKVIKRKGLTIGIIALTNPRAIDVVMRDGANGLANADPSTATLDFVFKQKGKCDILIAISNLEWRQDSLIATANPGLDLIIGSASEQATEKVRVIKGVPIVNSRGYGKNLGCISLTVDVNQNRITAYTNELLAVEPGAAPPDLDVQKLVDGLPSKYVGTKPVEIAKLTSDLKLNPDGPCNLTQWVADALYTAERRANIVLIRNGDIKSGAAQGSLTDQVMLDMFPYDTPVVVVQIIGSEVKRIVSRQLGGALPALTWSGLTVTPAKKKGLLEINIQGKPVLDEEMYVLLTTGTLWADAGEQLGIDPHIRAAFSLPGINVREYLTEVAKFQKVFTVDLDERWKTE